MRTYRSITFTLLCLLGVVSCRTADTLTEDEILSFDKEGWFYSIHMFDPYLGVGVPNITVQVTAGGELFTLTSNATGTVEFTAGFNSELDVSVSGQDGYFSLSRRIFVFNEESPFRSKSISFDFILFPEADYATFTVQGKAEIQSNLTTTERETASGAKFVVEVGLGDGDLLIPVTTDAAGRYKVRLPARDNIGSYKFIYEAYVANQTIAINRLSSQPAFPATVPSIAQIETSFDPTNSSISTIPLVRPVFAKPSDTPSGAGALIANLAINTNINSLGTITFISINSVGFGYAANSLTLPISITSLQGGSGAQITANTDASGQITSINLLNGGSGYPAFNANANKFGIPGQGFSAGFANNSFLNFGITSNFTPGAIIINDIYYGTGSTRSVAVN